MTHVNNSHSKNIEKSLGTQLNLIRNLKNSGLQLSAGLALNRSDTNIKPKIVFKVQAFSQTELKVQTTVGGSMGKMKLYF